MINLSGVFAHKNANGSYDILIMDEFQSGIVRPVTRIEFYGDATAFEVGPEIKVETLAEMNE